MVNAKKDTPKGEQLTRDLEKDLLRIDAHMRKSADALGKEAEQSVSPDTDVKVLTKVERMVDTLTHEMMKLASAYHRNSDIRTINRFLDSQKHMIQSTLTTDQEPEKRQSLDMRINELYTIMAGERKRLRKVGRKEFLKYAVTLAVATVSLCVSIYALIASS